MISSNLENTLSTVASMVNSDLGFYKEIVNTMTDEEFDELQERIRAFNLCQSRAAKMLNAEQMHKFFMQVKNSTRNTLIESEIKIDKETNTFTDENGDIFPCEFNCKGMGILNWENFLEYRAEAGLGPIPAAITVSDKDSSIGEYTQHSYWDAERFQSWKDSKNSSGGSIIHACISESKAKKAPKKKSFKEARVPRSGKFPVTIDTKTELAREACASFENFLKEKGFVQVDLDAEPVPKSYRVREEVNGDCLVFVSINGEYEDEIFIKIVNILAVGFMYHLDSMSDSDFVHIGESIQDMLHDAEYAFRFI